MSRTSPLVFGVIAVLGAVGMPSQALAATTLHCDASNPATPVFQQSPSERKVQLDSTNRTQKEFQYALILTGCRLGSGTYAVRLIGIRRDAGIVARLDVGVDGHGGALVIDPSDSTLRPGNYPLTAVCDNRAVSLWHPLTINVKDSRVLPPAAWTTTGVVLALVVLAMRTAAVSTGREWSNFVAFFRQQRTLLPALVGLSAAWAAVQSRVVANDNWYGTMHQEAGLMITVATAVITAGTATTAATGSDIGARPRARKATATTTRRTSSSTTRSGSQTLSRGAIPTQPARTRAASRSGQRTASGKVQ